MALQISLQILLPTLLLIGLWRGVFKSRLEFFLSILAVTAGLLFVFLTARWDSSSYYLRFLLPVLLAAAAYKSFRATIQPRAHTPKLNLSAALANAAILLVFSALSLVALSGYVAPQGAIQLSYPLRDGAYYVGGGGNSRLINNHQAHEPQKFALDIIRLNRFGRPAWGLAPGDLEQYAIFGDTVFSPCSGRVIRAVDGLPDLNPPNRDSANLAGNHVVIACENAEVILAHLKQGSVKATSGAQVYAGDILGQVGNSGNTSQPHLHLHAERGGAPGVILNGEGVPIEFAGRFLVRNSVFSGR